MSGSSADTPAGGDTPATGPTLPQMDDGTARAYAAWSQAGHDGQRFLDAIGHPTTPVPSPNPSNDAPAPAPWVSSGILPKDTAQMVAGLKAAGVSQAAIDAALAADGIPITADPRSAAEIEHDAQHGYANPVKPSDVDPLPWRSLAPGASVEAVASLQSQAATLISELALDPGIGSSLVEHLITTAQQTSKMTPHAKDQWETTQRVIMEGKYGGPDGLKQAMTEVAAYLKQSSASDLREQLVSKGMSAWAFATLHNSAARYAQWQAGKPKKQEAA